MPQPVNPLIRIAEDDVNTPSTGLPNKKEPTTVLQTLGWDKDQIVAGNHLNYILDNLAEYIVWLQEQVNITVPETRTLTAGDGIDGGGDLTADRSFAVDNTVARTTRTLTAGDGIDGGGDLTADRSFAVDNSVVRTTRTINGNPLSADITLDSSEITGASSAVLAGSISHGATIPLPSGYSLAQCKFIVSIDDSGTGVWDVDEGLSQTHYRTVCNVDQNTGVVTAQRIVWVDADFYQTTPATANYMVVGVK